MFLYLRVRILVFCDHLTLVTCVVHVGPQKVTCKVHLQAKAHWQEQLEDPEEGKSLRTKQKEYNMNGIRAHDCTIKRSSPLLNRPLGHLLFRYILSVHCANINSSLYLKGKLQHKKWYERGSSYKSSPTLSQCLFWFWRKSCQKSPKIECDFAPKLKNWFKRINSHLSHA